MVSTMRRRRRLWLLKVLFVLVTAFAAGLVTSGVVAGAGPLAALSTSTETTDSETTETETTESESTETESTEPAETETTETTETDTTGTETTETESTPTPGTPSITTGKDDYVPTEYVDIYGTGWLPDETVELFVDDHEGKTWSHTATITADEQGALEYYFRLPEHFVATYSVLATGDVSGDAQWTFTDSIAQGGVFSGSNSSSGVPAQRLTLSVPAIPAGGIAVAQIVVHKDLGSGQICAPTGWTSIDRTERGSGVYVQHTFRKTGAAGAASEEWTFRASCPSGSPVAKGASGGVVVFTGVDTASPIRDNDEATGSSSGSPTAPSSNAVVGDMVLRLFGHEKNSALTNSSGTEIWDLGGSNVSTRRAGGYTASHASGSTTGDFSVTTSDSGEWTAQTIVLRMAIPASAAPVVNSPICSGATSVSGTSSEANGTTIEVFKNGVSVGTTTVTGGAWTKTGLAALAAGDQIKARATASGKTVSSDSNIVTVVTCNTPPAAAANLAQFRSNGSTAIPLGGSTNETTVVLKGDVSDPDTNDSVKLEVEIKPVGTPFDGTGLVSGSAVTEPATAAATVSSLADGGYHWRGRAVDDDGAQGPWTSFGANAETDADFTVDTVKPTLTASATSPPDGPAYVAGTWTNQDVKVAFACTDPGSGVGTDTVPDVTLSTDGANQSVTSTGICADNAGNQADPATFSNIDIDQTAPEVSCGSPDGAWHASDVSIACTANDAVSDLVSSGDASFSLTTSVPAGTETDNASTDSRVIFDNAGNSTTAGPIAGNKVDKKDPSISCTVPDQSVWYGSNVTVNCTATDGGSGLDDPTDASFSLTTSVAAGTHDATAATGTKTIADDVGNTDTVGPYTFKVDLADPTVTCTPPDASVWYGSNVTVNCTATDNGGSGLADLADASFSLATTVPAGTEDANASTPSKTVTDAVGNADTAGPFTFKVDRKAPMLSCTPPDATVWYADNVTVSCTAADGGSGLDDPADASFALTTSLADGFEDAAAATGTRTVADDAGNTDTIGPFTFKVDRKAPQLTGCDAPDGAWHATDVTLSCTYTDGGSGPASQQVDLSTDVTAGTETDDAAASAGGDQACDAVSNCAASPADIGGNKVDKKDPSISCTVPDQSVWYGANVTVNCTATDGGSGLDDSADASFSLTTSVAAGTHDATAATGTKTVADDVGNTDTVGPYTFKVDLADPTVTCTPPDASVWYGSNVTVNCTATDNGGSGLADPTDASFSLATTVPAGTEDANASTPSKTVTDAVGNADTAGPFTFKVDRKAPVLSCGTADGAWHANDVSIACTASDGGSGLANAADAGFTLSTSVAAGTETANASTGTRVVSDAVGNSATAGPIAGNKVDKKGPAVTLSCAATVILGSSATASWTAADGGSGVQAGYGNGSIVLDTSSVGPKTATVAAGTSKDNVDNPSAAASCGYSVVFAFQGFFQPVDNNGVLNVVQAGRAIPVKFSLGGNQGLNILAAGYPKSTVVPCNGSASTDTLEETSTAGNSSLQFDPGVNAPIGQYIYVWKTEKAWASSCRRLDVKLVDGTMRSALFSFKK